MREANPAIGDADAETGQPVTEQSGMMALAGSVDPSESDDARKRAATDSLGVGGEKP